MWAEVVPRTWNHPLYWERARKREGIWRTQLKFYGSVWLGTPVVVSVPHLQQVGNNISFFSCFCSADGSGKGAGGSRQRVLQVPVPPGRDLFCTWAALRAAWVTLVDHSSLSCLIPSGTCAEEPWSLHGRIWAAAAGKDATVKNLACGLKKKKKISWIEMMASWVLKILSSWEKIKTCQDLKSSGSVSICNWLSSLPFLQLHK